MLGPEPTYPPSQPPDRGTTASPADDEYGVVDFRGGTALVSLVFFVASLGSRHLVDAADLTLPGLPRVVLPGLFSLLFAFVGLLSGVAGLWGPRPRPALTKLAVFVNAAALALSLLGTLAFFLILP